MLRIHLIQSPRGVHVVPLSSIFEPDQKKTTQSVKRRSARNDFSSRSLRTRKAARPPAQRRARESGADSRAYAGRELLNNLVKSMGLQLANEQIQVLSEQQIGNVTLDITFLIWLPSQGATAVL